MYCFVADSFPREDYSSLLTLTPNSLHVVKDISTAPAALRSKQYAPSCHAAVAAPAQQRSQVISRSEHPRARSPGCTSFFLKKVDDVFLVIALKTQRPPMPLRLFHCQNKTNEAVRYGKIFIFLFTLLPKQSKAIGRAEPGRWIFQRGHLT